MDIFESKPIKRRMADIQVYLAPLFDEASRMTSFIENNGFVDYTRFRVYDTFCYIDFPSLDRALSFVETFDGMRTNSCKLVCYITQGRAGDRVDRRRDDASSSRPARTSRSLHSKTILIKNYPAEYLGDRNLWNDFRECGFIRQVDVRGSAGYIQFDTEPDALNAVDEMNGKRLNGNRIQVELIPDRILNLPHLVVPLIAAPSEREGKTSDVYD
jgi:hypothetical protein